MRDECEITAREEGRDTHKHHIQHGRSDLVRFPEEAMSRYCGVSYLRPEPYSRQRGQQEEARDPEQKKADGLGAQHRGGI